MAYEIIRIYLGSISSPVCNPTHQGFDHCSHWNIRIKRNTWNIMCSLIFSYDMEYDVFFESEMGYLYEIWTCQNVVKKGFPLGKSQNEGLCSLLFEQRIGGLTLLRSRLWMVDGFMGHRISLNTSFRDVHFGWKLLFKRMTVGLHHGNEVIAVQVLHGALCHLGEVKKEHELCTLPETNIAPENRPGPKRKRSYSNHPFSGAMLVFGGVPSGNTNNS